MASSSRLKGFIVHGSGCFFLAAIILIHLGLVGLGQWLADEYDDFARLERDGWIFVWDRLKWSPRPLSEFVYCAYGWMVNHLHRPLIGLFLGALWLGLIAAGLLTSWQTFRQGRQNRRQRREQHQTEQHQLECHKEDQIWPGLLVALALMALFVTSTGHTIWIFYWPAAAASYLPTLAATTLLFLQVAHGRLSRSGGRLLCAFCLIIAACSTEAGATFVLCYGLLQAIQWGVAAFQKRDNFSSRAFVWWLLPTIISAVVLLIVRFNRFHVMESTAIAAGPTKGHPLASLIASMRTLLLETAGQSAHLGAWHGPGSRLPSEILLAVGVALCWSRFGRLMKTLAAQILTIVAALWLASLFTIAAANLHFGAVCCDQHEALRRCWILLSIAGMGMLSSNWIGRGRLQWYAASRVLTQVLLCAAVLSAWHIKPVLQTFRNYIAVQQTTERNFHAGFSTGDKQMVFLLPPDGLISHPQIEPGNYTLSPENPRDVHYVLMYFKKSSMVVRPSN